MSFLKYQLQQLPPTLSNVNLNRWLHKLFKHAAHLLIERSCRARVIFKQIIQTVCTTRKFKFSSWIHYQMLALTLETCLKKFSLIFIQNYTHTHTDIFKQWKIFSTLVYSSRHSMMTKQDKMMWLVSCDSQRSLLECVTCRKTLHGHVGMLFQKYGKFLDSLHILNRIYYSLGHSQSIRFRHQVQSFMVCPLQVHTWMQPLTVSQLLHIYLVHVHMCACVMCHSQRFHFIAKQSGNNS